MSNEIHFDPDKAAGQILYLLESVIKRFDQNDNSIAKLDSERSDLDHMIELTAFNAAEGYQLVKKVKDNRRHRRICKDENHAMKPLYEFIKRNGDQMLRDYRRIAKETEKQSEYLEKRQYHPRTNVIAADVFQKKRVKP